MKKPTVMAHTHTHTHKRIIIHKRKRRLWRTSNYER